MADIHSLHKEAISLAEEAFIAKKQGNKEEALEIFERAFDKERKAALIQKDNFDYEPTRSVLFRSAASLAIQIEKFHEAEKLISHAFIGSPPEEIANELRELWDQAQFNRHLKLNGIDLDYNEVQLSLAGGESVGFGIILGEIFTERIEYFKKLIERTTERLSNISYRKGGAPKAEVRNKFPVYLSAARAQSFAVSIRVGLSTQLEIPFADSPRVNIVEELIECLKLINDSDENSLRSRIGDDDYYANFVGLARKIAPDGNKVKQVGFTSLLKGRIDFFSLQRKEKLIEIPEPEIHEEKVPVEIEGYLKYADALPGSHKIKLVDDQNKRHTIDVPASLMNDIVRPLWDFRVVVKGLRKKDGNIILKDIERVD